MSNTIQSCREICALQEGEPDVFGTITVNEWEFPLHTNILDAMTKLVRENTNLPAYEVIHHAHVLTETVWRLML